MARADHPLVIIGGLDDSSAPGMPPRIHKTSFSVTGTGKEVLDGRADFVALNGIDLWMGGAHLDDKNAPWRWSEHDQKLRRLRLGREE
jgi:hypothetical protein